MPCFLSNNLNLEHHCHPANIPIRNITAIVNDSQLGNHVQSPSFNSNFKGFRRLPEKPHKNSLRDRMITDRGTHTPRLKSTWLLLPP